MSNVEILLLLGIRGLNRIKGGPCLHFDGTPTSIFKLDKCMGFFKLGSQFPCVSGGTGA